MWKKEVDKVKLSRFGPKSRTVLIVSIALMLALAISSVAFGRELRVTTAADLVSCAAGVALAAGPDAGAVSAAGDTCVLLPGTYAVAANIVVTLQNLTIRS
ncbi:MAG: hypothetical protein GWN87_28785, partial [Desulfuromonadales bacterium]|nr:hypothetical protein [Desulfuromonadales bacterium]